MSGMLRIQEDAEKEAQPDNPQKEAGDVMEPQRPAECRGSFTRFSMMAMTGLAGEAERPRVGIKAAGTAHCWRLTGPAPRSNGSLPNWPGSLLIAFFHSNRHEGPSTPHAAGRAPEKRDRATGRGKKDVHQGQRTALPPQGHRNAAYVS